ncbi:MAG: ECF transporter S component [Oscillospiraceae bacterium]|jgi:uncharacterized membrane protein|nr:ECF transporter S component [Oscillospiraceae bacterium]
MSVAKRYLLTGYLVRLAALTAILIIMGVTPLGYLRVNPVMTITFNMIPVVIGSIILGPLGGAVLGGVFGLTSFSQCFGADPFGTALLNQSFLSAVYVFLMCVLPRVLAGLLPGFIYKALRRTIGRKESGHILAITLTALSGALLNTALFIFAIWAFFGGSEISAGAFGTKNLWAYYGILVAANAVWEWIVCTIVGGAVGRALIHFIPVKQRS